MRLLSWTPWAVLTHFAVPIKVMNCIIQQWEFKKIKSLGCFSKVLNIM